MIKYREAYIPIVAIITAAAYIIMTKSLPRESIIFPQTILVAMGVFGILIIYSESKIKSSIDAGNIKKSKAPLVMGTTLIFLLVFIFFGFMIAAPIYLFSTLLLLRQPLKMTILTTIGLTATIYLIFTVAFRIPL